MRPETALVSLLRRLRSDHPSWKITISLEEILEQLAREPTPVA
jgi:hypothetical protein